MNILKKTITRVINAVQELEDAHECKSVEQVQQQYNPPPMPPVAQPKQDTMYAVNLYITIEDLNNYIRNHVDEKFKDATFIPADIRLNWNDLSFDILLLSTDFQGDDDGCRYKLDINKITEEN